MSPSSSSKPQTLVVIGSGPGVGVSTARLFASRGFNRVALISRDAARLEVDRGQILDFVRPRSSEVEVRTWSVDITDSAALRGALDEVGSVMGGGGGGGGGGISCVLFNAARVGTSRLLEFEEGEIVRDFLTTNIALYTTAKWAVPILLLLVSRRPDPDPDSPPPPPTFLVTSSLLWTEPIPAYFSLSLVKAAQRNLVQSLAATYPAIHFALLNVGGQVSRDDSNDGDHLSPDVVAGKLWELYSQGEGEWTLDLDILGGGGGMR